MTRNIRCQLSACITGKDRRQRTGSLMKGCNSATFYPSAVSLFGQTCQSIHTAAAVPATDGACQNTVAFSFQLFLPLEGCNMCCTVNSGRVLLFVFKAVSVTRQGGGSAKEKTGIRIKHLQVFNQRCVVSEWEMMEMSRTKPLYAKIAAPMGSARFSGVSLLLRFRSCHRFQKTFLQFWQPRAHNTQKR